MLTLTPAMIRAARGYLDWSQAELAKRSGLAIYTIQQIEAGREPRENSLDLMRRVFEPFVEFNELTGAVQPRGNHMPSEMLTGLDCLPKFLNLIYDTLGAWGGELLISGLVEDKLYFWLGQEGYATHHKRMEELQKSKPFTARFLVQESDRHFPASAYAEYRWTHKPEFVPAPLCIVNNKAALLYLEQSIPHIILIDSPLAAAQFKSHFMALWERALPPVPSKDECTKSGVNIVPLLPKTGRGRGRPRKNIEVDAMRQPSKSTKNRPDGQNPSKS